MHKVIQPSKALALLKRVQEEMWTYDEADEACISIELADEINALFGEPLIQATEPASSLII